MLQADDECIHDIITLMDESKVHQLHTDEDIEDWVITAIRWEQALLWYAGETPVAYVSWAFLDEEQHRQMLAGPHLIPFSKWRSGPYIWMLDVIAPYGHLWSVLRQLKKISDIPSQRVYWRRRKVKES